MVAYFIFHIHISGILCKFVEKDGKMEKRRENIVEIISRELKEFAPEAHVILYGSQARGDAREESDFDLLILLPDFTNKKEFVERRSEISGRLFELSLNLEADISPLILPFGEWENRVTPFSINVNREGIRI